jgi:sporulation protein YlmC with PRC-barrel domain
MRLSDLRDKAVRSLDGDKLGRVHEVHCKDGQVVALMCGPGSLIERWTGQSEGRRVPWEAVHRIEADAVVIAETGAKRMRRGSQPAR